MGTAGHRFLDRKARPVGLLSLEEGDDVRDGLRCEAEVGRGIHEGFLHRLHLCDAALRNGLHGAAHALDEHGISIAEDNTGDDQTIGRFDFGAFESMRDLRGRM